jgi:TonB family protein
MILGVMAFLFVASVTLALAATIADDGLRRSGVATRWLWLGSLLAPPLLLLGPSLLPFGRSEAAGRALSAVPILELGGLVIGPGGASGGRPVLGFLLAAVWLASSVGLAVLLFRTHRTLTDERSRWPTSNVSGRDVYLSTDRGPAVAGVLRPWIVIPRWSLDLPEQELRFVVLHEEEHVRARDSLLLAGALALLVLTPWNPISWWQLRRLRTAMEVDCDRRVLRRAPDAGAYGNSLLSVAARASGPSLGLAAFTEKSLSLRTRIVAMTPNPSRWTRVQAGLLLFLALVVGLQACGVDNPVANQTSEDETQEAQRTQESAVQATPSFTPFTVAPAITNRQEIVEALERSYPPLLRDAGIGGRVLLFFYINALGVAEEIQIHESSGHQALDEAALRVGSVYRFSPALNRDEPVPVWVLFPITFQARDP